ncbi:DNA-binding response regulator, partial [Candidatus Poribacteria bacterium]|nr:DNA-binding response regulator [Candidatus Poribacteria bacterium]
MKKNHENYKKKILVTDDTEDLCVIIKDVLEEEGYAVQTLSNGYE